MGLKVTFRAVHQKRRKGKRKKKKKEKRERKNEKKQFSEFYWVILKSAATL